MKKFIYLSSIALALSFGFTSCSSNDEADEINTPNTSNGNIIVRFDSGLNAGTTWQGQGFGSTVGSKATLGDHTQYMILSNYQNVKANANLSSLNGTINADNYNLLVISNFDMTRTYEPIPNQVEYSITNYQETQELNQVSQTIIKGKLNFSGKFRCVDVMNNSAVIEESVEISGTINF